MSLSPEDLSALWISLVVAARAVAVALPLAVAVGWVLALPRLPGRRALNVVVHAPLVLPPVLVGYGLLLLFGARGLLGPALGAMGLHLAFTSAGASLAAGVCAFPLMVRPVVQALQAVDPALSEAARSLGAGPLDRAFSLHLPLALPGVASAAVVGFAACLGEFGAVITFAANIPGVTRTLPLAIYDALQQPGGEADAARLGLLSLALAALTLAVSDGRLGTSRSRAR